MKYMIYSKFMFRDENIYILTLSINRTETIKTCDIAK